MRSWKCCIHGHRDGWPFAREGMTYTRCMICCRVRQSEVQFGNAMLDSNTANNGIHTPAGVEDFWAGLVIIGGVLLGLVIFTVWIIVGGK
jgi:hypothetical protein